MAVVEDLNQDDSAKKTRLHKPIDITFVPGPMEPSEIVEGILTAGGGGLLVDVACRAESGDLVWCPARVVRQVEFGDVMFTVAPLGWWPGGVDRVNVSYPGLGIGPTVTGGEADVHYGRIRRRRPGDPEKLREAANSASNTSREVPPAGKLATVTDSDEGMVAAVAIDTNGLACPEWYPRVVAIGVAVVDRAKREVAHLHGTFVRQPIDVLPSSFEERAGLRRISIEQRQVASAEDTETQVAETVRKLVGGAPVLPVEGSVHDRPLGSGYVRRILSGSPWNLTAWGETARMPRGLEQKVAIREGLFGEDGCVPAQQRALVTAKCWLALQEK